MHYTVLTPLVTHNTAEMFVATGEHSPPLFLNCTYINPKCNPKGYFNIWGNILSEIPLIVFLSQN